MPQARLPFHYAEESKSTGMTSVSGLAMYLEVAHAAGLSESASRHVKVREGAQGWTDAQMVTSLILLNTAGGESVDDPRSSRGQALRILESDDGLGRVMQSAETHGMRRGERRAHQRRWRKQRRRSVPSPSAVFRYLGEFHDPSEEDRRRPHKAFIPKPTLPCADCGRSTPTWSQPWWRPPGKCSSLSHCGGQVTLRSAHPGLHATSDRRGYG